MQRCKLFREKQIDLGLSVHGESVNLFFDVLNYSTFVYDYNISRDLNMNQSFVVVKLAMSLHFGFRYFCININDALLLVKCYFSSLLLKQYNWIYTLSKKKLDPYSFERNFGKYCPILIIILLLQTEINYDKVYHKIYRHTSNLLVHYLVK